MSRLTHKDIIQRSGREEHTLPQANLPVRFLDGLWQHAPVASYAISTSWAVQRTPPWAMKKSKQLQAIRLQLLSNWEKYEPLPGSKKLNSNISGLCAKTCQDPNRFDYILRIRCSYVYKATSSTLLTQCHTHFRFSCPSD